MLNAHFPFNGWLYVDRFIDFSRLNTKAEQVHEIAAGKNLWVIGDDINKYKNSSIATPYLNWQLSREQLRGTGFYDNLTEIFINLTQNPPEVIYDKLGIMEELFSRMPTIASNYERLEENSAVYILKAP